MKLNPVVHQFFNHYLPHIKGVSPYTIRAYRDAFKLFLPFAAKYHRVKIRSLRIEHITPKLVLDFLDDLQGERKNLPRTRNHRLAALKSFSKMVRFMYPDQRKSADAILNIPQKRFRKTLIGFLYHDEILKVFKTVDLRRKEGFRDYVLLHLLFDSGARASEIASLNLDYFNPQHNTLAILGKGDRFRLIDLPLYHHRLFVSQRGEELTRHGIYRLCQKHLTRALPPKRLQNINPVHSFRHSRAMDLLYRGQAITDIKNRLGHENLQSTMTYLQLDLNRRRHIQSGFIKYMQSVITDDPKIDELLQWEGKQDIMAWLDTL